LTTNEEKCLPVNDLINLVASWCEVRSWNSTKRRPSEFFSDPCSQVHMLCMCLLQITWPGPHDGTRDFIRGSPQTPCDLQLQTDWHALSLCPSHLFPPLQLGPTELENDYLILYQYRSRVKSNDSKVNMLFSVSQVQDSEMVFEIAKQLYFFYFKLLYILLLL
jgi:hypothetical protein